MAILSARPKNTLCPRCKVAIAIKGSSRHLKMAHPDRPGWSEEEKLEMNRAASFGIVVEAAESPNRKIKKPARKHDRYGINQFEDPEDALRKARPVGVFGSIYTSNSGRSVSGGLPGLGKRR